MSSPLDVATIGWLRPADVVTLAVSFGLIYVVATLSSSFYNAFYGPLSKFPGPKLRAFSVIPKFLTTFHGTDNVDHLELHATYGPVVRIAPNELSIAGSGEAWKDVYGFRKSGAAGNVKPEEFYTLPPNRVANLIQADDATHTRQRKTVSHAFADKSLRELEPMLRQWAQKMKTKLGERAVAGTETDMLKFYNCTTFDIMGDLSFAEGLDMLEDGEYSPWVQTIFSSIKRGTQLRALRGLGSFWDWLIGDVLFSSPTIQRKQMEHWNYTTTRVDRRLARETFTHPDLWTRILGRAEHSPDEALSRAEHHSLASLFMIAGTETTATALSGVTYHLLRNPSQLSRLTSELRAAFPNPGAQGENVGLDALARLPYLTAVLKEGLRLYPPVPSGLPRRTPAAGTSVNGEFVPGGALVSVHQYASGRLPGAFAEVEEFRPERWLSPGSEGADPMYAQDRLDAVEPFSVGPRNCLGKNLAWHEMRLLLATVMLEFDLGLCEESKDWVGRQKVYTLWEKVPLMCTLAKVQR